MKKLFYLSTCSTCKRLMSGWNLPDDVQLIDIKKDMYTADDIAEMYRLTGSYEALFSKRSQNFVAQGLKDTIKSDEDYGKLLPTDYTFLKRPVLIFDEQIFVGNDKKTDEEVKKLLAVGR
jgi:arsenate reductase (glutaredoxin)